MPEKSSRKKRFLRKLKNKYRLIVYNDTTLEQVWYMRISRLNVLSIFVPLLLILVILIVVLIAFTPLREFIPGYPDDNTRRQIVYNALKADSLEKVVLSWDRYFDNVSGILSGKEPAPIDEMLPDTLQGRQSRASVLISRDSLFRAEVEREEQFNLSIQNSKKDVFENMLFYPPVKGTLTETFNPSENHFGVHISTDPNTAVTSILDGTVLATYWTFDEGYTIMIQHTDNLISVYKQVARLLKKTGDRVTSGEAIAFMGAPNDANQKVELHFELWHNGSPINPSIHITL
ncbi:MAG: M23 family metallopeptidase [Prevotellaceae bacterium]|jgi:murein DD-endopeptidase MepM/ murein hydrolase activator NlpD|nr:M23 family metallopeptidase [Prevotellaceae bacterium]